MRILVIELELHVDELDRELLKLIEGFDEEGPGFGWISPILARLDDTSSRSLAFRPLHYG